MIRIVLFLVAAMFASHSYAVGESYHPELHAAFKALDVNKDGMLDRSEVPPMIDFDQIDADRTQGISFAEFCKVQLVIIVEKEPQPPTKKQLVVPYKSSGQLKGKPKMQALKVTLTALGNQLEQQGFMTMNRRLTALNPNLTAKPLTDFIAWVNQTPEVQTALKAIGVDWTPPATAKQLGKNCPVRITSADDVSDFNEPPLVNLTGVVTEVDTIDNGASPDDPLFIVLLSDGRQEGFWTEQLEVISA